MAKTKNSGLGRGLDSIFVDNSSGPDSNGPTMLRLSDIEPRPDQPRKSFEAESLSQLADSIATHGLIQPIIVRPTTSGFYQIIAGERRWRASKMAGLNEIPVIITDYDDKKAAEAALIENIQRENLNPVEEAKALRSLIEDYDMTQEAAAKQVGRSRSAITNALRLLDLPDEVLALLASGSITSGHARALLGLNDKSELCGVAKSISTRELSVRAVENMVRALNNRSAEPDEDVSPSKPEVNYIDEIVKRVALQSGKKIKIVARGKAQRIEIPYSDDNELETLIKTLFGNAVFED